MSEMGHYICLSIWEPIHTAPEHVMVSTRINDDRGVRNEADLIRRGRMWFTSGPNAMYVYYAPTEWLKHYRAEDLPR